MTEKFNVKFDESWSPCYHGDCESTWDGIDLMVGGDYIDCMEVYELDSIQDKIDYLNKGKQYRDFEEGDLDE